MGDVAKSVARAKAKGKGKRKKGKVEVGEAEEGLALEAAGWMVGRGLLEVVGAEADEAESGDREL